MDKFKIGQLVWGKMKGFPPWPGRVSDPPETLKPKKDSVCIYFFGTNNYAYIEKNNVRDYLSNKDAVKVKNNSLKEACNAIEEYIKRGDNSPPDSSKPEEDAFDKLISPPPAPKAPKRSKKKDTPPKSDKKETPKQDVSKSSDKKEKIKGSPPKSPASPTPTKAKRASKLLERKRSGSISLNGDTPRKLKKKRESSVASSQDSPPVSPAPKEQSPEVNSFSPKLQTHNSKKFDLEPASDSDNQADVSINIVPSTLTFGFLGLGEMGSTIAKRLMASGHKVVVWNQSHEIIEKFLEQGADEGDNPADVVQKSDIIFSCLPAEIALEVMFKNDGVLEGMASNKSYVEMSPVDAQMSSSLAESVWLHGGFYLEAQLIGNKARAEIGSLGVICAGDEDVYQQCQGTLSAISDQVEYVGKVGSACRVALILRAMQGCVIGAVVEGLAAAHRFGLNLDDFVDLLKLTSVCSPLTDSTAKAINDLNFSNQTVPLQQLQRDLSNVVEMASKVDRALPVSSALNELCTNTRRSGYANHDASAIYIRAKF